MIADALDIEEKDVLRTVNEYTDALILLDQYDHQALSKPEGSTPVYRIHSMRRDTSSKYEKLFIYISLRFSVIRANGVHINTMIAPTINTLSNALLN